MSWAAAIARKTREGLEVAAKAPERLVVGPPAGMWVPSEADASCKAAWEYEQCTQQLATALAGRRAGKTASNQRLTARMLAQLGRSVIYVSLVEKNAKEQFFLPLLDLLSEHEWRSWDDRQRNDGQWDFRADRTALVLRSRWGGTLRAFSAHDMRTAGTIRGYPADLLILDEAQEPRDDVVRYLMDRVASAFVIDRGGWVRITGTVPQIEPSYFSEALDSPGWSHHAWTAFHHDLPKPRAGKVEDLQKLCEAKGWALQLETAGESNGKPVVTCGPDTSIEIASEFFGKRIKDPATMLYSYDPERNGESAPEGYCDTFAVGLDLGWTDLVTINVRGWRSDDVLMRSWQVYEWGNNELPAVAPEGRPSIAVELGGVLERWPAWIIVADDATGGDKISIATLSEMLGVEMESKPKNLGFSVELFNEDFRHGRAHVARGSATAAEIQAMRKIPAPNRPGWKFTVVASRRKTRNADGTEGKLSHKDYASAARLAHGGVRAYWNAARPETQTAKKPFFEMNHQEMEAERNRVAQDWLRNPMGGR